MGYADTLPYQMLILNTHTWDNLSCSTVSTTTVLDHFHVPDFKRPVSLAYLDVIVQQYEDVSHLENMLSAVTWKIKDATGTYQTAGVSGGHTLRCKADEKCNGQFRLSGYLDIHSYIVPNSDQLYELASVQASHDTLELYSIYGELRLYFNV